MPKCNYVQFHNYLIEQGIGPSRAPSLANAIGELHFALCQCDFRNAEIIGQIGLYELMFNFAKCEQVRNPEMPRPK